MLRQVPQSTLLDVDHMVSWWAQWDAVVHEVRAVDWLGNGTVCALQGGRGLSIGCLQT